MSRDWALLERFDAPSYDEPYDNYMTRWRVISTPWLGLYVHRIDQPDPRPTLHDHPWPFITLILKGAYTENFGSRARADDTTGPIVLSLPRTWRRWTVHRMRKTDPHTITVVHRSPTWTLVLVGRRHPEPSWGYWDENGFTSFDEHHHAAEFAAAMEERRRRDRRPFVEEIASLANRLRIEPAVTFRDGAVRAALGVLQGVIQHRLHETTPEDEQ